MRYVIGAGGGDSGGGSSRVAVEDPDSLQSHQYVKIIDLISEGETGGLVNGLRSVYLNDTPVISADGATNFSGVTLETRNGANDQTVFSGFSDTESEVLVNTQVLHGTPITKHIAMGADAARVTLGFPNLTKQDAETGDLHGTSVNVSISVNNNGGGAQPAAVSFQWDSSTTSVTGLQVDTSAGYGVQMTATINVSYTVEQITDCSEMGYSWQHVYAAAVWRVEYKPPGGAWTFLARDSDASADTVSRTYSSPQGALGAWAMRLVVESGGSGYISGALGLQLAYTDTISGKTTSRYKRSYYIDLPAPGPWDITVTRNTPDSASSSLYNETWWDSMASVVESKFNYPNSMVAGVSIDAQYFSDIPSRAYEIYGIKCQVPANYDTVARIYTGMWNGTFTTAWTNNPAWIYYDLLTSERYGLGEYIDASGIDKWALYEIAKYCDELVPSGYGYMEPRFTCNLYIQAREDAYKVLTNLASVFRGMAYWGAGQVIAVADMPSDPVALFTNANVIDGEFSYAGSARTARHTVALVTWNDPADMYKQVVEYVSDDEGIARYGVNTTEVIAFGCTSRGQAHRYGKWILYTERMESEVVTWKTGLEGTSVYPGAIVKVADNLRSGDRIGGRILDATTSTVTLDAPVTLAALSSGVYTLSVVLPEGATITHEDGTTTTSKGGEISDHTVTNAPGTYSTLNISPAFTTPPQKYAMWILASENLNPQTYRILSVTESDKTQVQVTALQHEPGKYALIEQGIKFDALKTSDISTSAPAIPTSLLASDTLYLQGPGVVGTKLHFGWVSQTPRFEVRWKQNTGNYTYDTSKTNSCDIAPVVEGPIVLQVRGIDVLGRSSEWAELNYTVIGKTAAPAAVTGLTSVITPTGIVAGWDQSEELDWSRYEVRVNGVLADTVSVTQWTYPYTPTGTTTISVYAIDTTGNYSVVASTSVTITAPNSPMVSYGFSANQVVLTITPPSAQLPLDYYEVFDGTISLGKTYATTFNILGSWSGNKTFTVTATDTCGNTSAARSVTVTIIAPQQPQLTYQVIDNNVLLYWTCVAGSLPIETFNARRGSTWATAEVIGDKSGGFTTLFETASGNYTYWLAARDTAGNYGTPVSATATVSQPPDYVLRADIDSTLSGTLSSAILENGAVLFPINTTETFAQHFANHSWTTPQAQIDAGYPHYAQPNIASGFYEETFDYGATLASSKITISPTGSTMYGSVSLVTTISIKLNAEDVWTDYVGVTQIYGTNFRYVKVKIVASGTASLYAMTALNVRLDSKLISDGGMVACVSSDTSGTQVNFNRPFIDVTNIQVTASGVLMLTPVYDFTDTSNPTGFKVLLFNSSGIRVSGTVSWSAEGY